MAETHYYDITTNSATQCDMIDINQHIHDGHLFLEHLNGDNLVESPLPAATWRAYFVDIITPLIALKRGDPMTSENMLFQAMEVMNLRGNHLSLTLR
jgi:hypothetical protein